MQSFLEKLVNSKARLMVAFRYIFGGLVILMGAARLRIVLLLLASPATFEERDILQEYLMGKALVAGVNPYLPLDRLAEMFIGKFSFLTHPAPHPPFLAVLSMIFSGLTIGQVIIVWFVIEMVCIIAIASMLTYLWKGRVVWWRAGILAFLLLAWYPVMVDLLFGQLSILLTTLLLAGLLAWRINKKVLAGVFAGLTIAIKMFTWPLLLYFAIKKDWRTFISSCVTAAGLNLLAVLIMGIGPVSDYYFRVTVQVGAIYHSFLKNYSLWSIGYRLFDGTRPIGVNYISAPPLVYQPRLASFVSAGIAAVFLITGLIWAARARDKDIAYSIILCVIVAVSPIAWDHYYILITTSILILLLNLSQRKYPNIPTITFLIVVLSLFLFTEYIPQAIYALNGGAAWMQANSNRISFGSSLLEILPMVELVILTILLWRASLALVEGARLDQSHSN